MSSRSGLERELPSARPRPVNLLVLGPEHHAVAGQAMLTLRAALHRLTTRQHLAVVALFGLYGTPPLTLRDLAPLLGVTTGEGARQVVLRALWRLWHVERLRHAWQDLDPRDDARYPAACPPTPQRRTA